jgi:hypothetical protein
MGEPDEPAIRVTFEEAAPLFQHDLRDELTAEGFDVQPGPPPMEQRGAPEAAVGVLLVTIQLIRTGREIEDSVAWVAKIVRGIERVVRRSKTVPETVVTIYGPDNEPLKEVHIPRRESR